MINDFTANAMNINSLPDLFAAMAGQESSAQSQNLAPFLNPSMWSKMTSQNPASQPQVQNGTGLPQAQQLQQFQIFQDWLTMNTPVGSAPNDDVVIARALFDSKDKGQTYKQALDALHGVNNHASNLWKDYYLDHHERLDLLMSRLSDQPISAKKPFAPSLSASQIPHKRVPPPPRIHTTSSKSRLPSTSRAYGGSSKTPEPTGRKTFNSITAPSQTQDVPNLLPPHASIIIPDAPSRSPTPPTLIIVGKRGNKYTEEDRSFFLKFISWELKNDPSLSKKELCEKLAEKAPHHSATSWAGHWHSRHDIADKILAAAEAQLESDDSDSDADADGEHEYSVEEIIDSDGEDAVSANLIGSEYGDLDDNTEEDVKEMALPGAAPRPADFRVLARYVASVSDWHAHTAVAKLRQFSDKHPQKSARAWAELYSDNEEDLEKLVQHYKKRRVRQPAHTQHGTPSWAKLRVPPLKRKPTEDDDDDDDDDVQIVSSQSNLKRRKAGYTGF